VTRVPVLILTARVWAAMTGRGDEAWRRSERVEVFFHRRACRRGSGGLVGEELFHHAGRVAEESAAEAAGVGFLVGHRLQTVLAAFVDDGVGVGEQERRVGGDDQLGAVADEGVEVGEHGELPLGAEGGLRFVKEVDTVAAEPLSEQSEEGLAVRAFVGRATAPFAVGDGGVVFVRLDLRHERVEAFRAEEEPVGFAIGGGVTVADHGEEIGENRVSVAGGKPVVPAAAFGRVAETHREGFEQGGFATAIFADEERHGAVQRQFVEGAHGRDSERVPVPVGNGVAFEPQRAKESAAGWRFGHGKKFELRGHGGSVSGGDRGSMESGTMRE